MFTTDLRTAGLAVLAAAGIALSAATVAPAAHAEPANGSAKRGGCDDNGHLMDNGQFEKYVGKYERRSGTCTDGTVCTSTGTLQLNGTRRWTYECHDAPMARSKPTTARPAVRS